MFKGRSKNKGFTLIELVIVIIILGILAAVAVPKFVDITTKANESASKAGLSSLRSACTMFYASTANAGTARYPSTSGELASALSGPVPVNRCGTGTESQKSAITGDGVTVPILDVSGWLYCTTGSNYGSVYAGNNTEW